MNRVKLILILILIIGGLWNLIPLISFFTSGDNFFTVTVDNQSSNKIDSIIISYSFDINREYNHKDIHKDITVGEKKNIKIDLTEIFKHATRGVQVQGQLYFEQEYNGYILIDQTNQPNNKVILFFGRYYERYFGVLDNNIKEVRVLITDKEIKSKYIHQDDY